MLRTATCGEITKSDLGKEVKLCGCGHSEDKPYCDGSHKKY